MKIFKNKKKKKIFIHIGFMKTGTSAIQSYLIKNQKILNQNKYYYPKINIEAMNYLGFSLLDEIPPKIHHRLPINRKELYNNLIKEIEKTKLEKIILTAEAFSLISSKYFLGIDAPQQLFKLLKNENYEFKIIAFIRRQDDYLESQYNQHIKTHNFWNLYSDDILTFYKEKEELFNFKTIIDRWAIVFGKSNVIIKVYDKNENSVSKFLKILDITEQVNGVIHSDVNQKLNAKSLEFMRIANKYEIEKNTAKQNYELIDLIEKGLGITKESFALLSNKESFKIMELHKKSNTELSNEYLKGDLTWCLPQKKELDNTKSIKLTTDESVQVATYIWNHFQKTNN